MARFLGLDVGSHRTGVSLSDPTGTIATALTVLPIESRRRLAQAVAALVLEHDVEAVVMGLPLNLKGEEGPAAMKVRAFVQKLVRRVHVPIHLWDERYSTRDAMGAMQTLGMTIRQGREAVDMVAATLILQSWLDVQQEKGA